MARLGKFFYINGTDNLSNAHFLRVRADGGITESLGCIDTAGTLLESASYFMRPSGYKEDTVYSLIPNNSNGSLSFTRASDAWRTEIGGLVQRSPWNLARYSEDFSNAVWVSDGTTTVTTNATNDPNGNLTADRLQMSNSQRRYIYQNITVSASTLTYSIYLRASSNQTVRIGSDQMCAFYRGALICNVTTEWQRFSLTVTGVTAGNLAIVIDNITSNITQCTGTASTIDLFAWGAQLVEGVDQLPYFPTTDRLNVPRLDYTYGSCPALLLEPQRTNLALQSESFDNASWSKPSGWTVTANATTSPDGTSNADLITPTNFNNLSQACVVTTSTNYAVSIYVKRNTTNSTWVSLIFSGGTSISYGYIINWSTLSISLIPARTAAINPTFESVGNGWYRISFVCASGNNISSSFQIIPDSQSGTNSIYLYGAQLELGAYATTYIPTTTASATRIADSFSRNNIYTNGLITSSGGTWFVEFKGNNPKIRDGFMTFGLTDAASNNGFYFNQSSGASQRLTLNYYLGGVATTSVYTTTTDSVKIAIKWNGSTADIFQNGVKVVSNISFTFTQMQILNCSGVGITTFTQQMALFNYPLSDSDCQLLTT